MGGEPGKLDQPCLRGSLPRAGRWRASRHRLHIELSQDPGAAGQLQDLWSPCQTQTLGQGPELGILCTEKSMDTCKKE